MLCMMSVRNVSRVNNVCVNCMCVVYVRMYACMFCNVVYVCLVVL